MIEMIRIMMLVLAHGWRPSRWGERVKRDNFPFKLIVILFAEIQNWGRC